MNRRSRLQASILAPEIFSSGALFMENYCIEDTYVKRLTAIKLYLQIYPIWLLQVLTNYGKLYPRKMKQEEEDKTEKNDQSTQCGRKRRVPKNFGGNP